MGSIPTLTEMLTRLEAQIVYHREEEARELELRFGAALRRPVDARLVGCPSPACPVAAVSTRCGMEGPTGRRSTPCEQPSPPG